MPPRPVARIGTRRLSPWSLRCGWRAVRGDSRPMAGGSRHVSRAARRSWSRGSKPAFLPGGLNAGDLAVIAGFGAVAAPRPALAGWWLVPRLALLVLAVQCWRLALLLDGVRVEVRNLLVTRRVPYSEMEGIEMRASYKRSSVRVGRFGVVIRTPPSWAAPRIRPDSRRWCLPARSSAPRRRGSRLPRTVPRTR